MSLSGQPSLKPFSAEYLNTFRPADPNAAAQESKLGMFVAQNGTTRVDSGDQSIIREVGSDQATLLDHAKKEARVVDVKPPPLPPPPGAPMAVDPAVAAAAAVPAAPPIHVTDLGKRWIDGHEVQGKRYEYPPPERPKLPELEKLEGPAMAQAPGAPKSQDVGGGTKPPPPPLPNTVSEVWTSTSLLIPMLSRTKTAYGEQISKATSATAGPPHPSLFQIPPGYKMAAPEPAGKKLA